MAIRNSQELGVNLLKIAQKLCENQRLCRLLKYTNDNPFEVDDKHPNLKVFDVLHKNIKVVPLVNENEDNTESTVVIIYDSGEVQNNTEFKRMSLDILVYVPLSEWTLNDVNLRPFLIMSEIEKEIKGKRVESLGEIRYNGFSMNLVTDIMSCYRMEFEIDVFN